MVPARPVKFPVRFNSPFFVLKQTHMRTKTTTLITFVIFQSFLNSESYAATKGFKKYLKGALTLTLYFLQKGTQILANLEVSLREK